MHRPMHRILPKEIPFTVPLGSPLHCHRIPLLDGYGKPLQDSIVLITLFLSSLTQSLLPLNPFLSPPFFLPLPLLFSFIPPCPFPSAMDAYLCEHFKALPIAFVKHINILRYSQYCKGGMAAYKALNAQGRYIVESRELSLVPSLVTRLSFPSHHFR